MVNWDAATTMEIAKLFMPTIRTTRCKFAIDTAHQGVANDGDYIYTTTNDALYKYTLEGALVGSLPLRINEFYCEDFCVVDNLAYVPLTNYNKTAPRAGKIQVVDVGQMSLLRTIDLAENVHPASLAHKDGSFWLTVTEDASIYMYDKNFNFKKRYTFPVIGEDASFGELGAGYSGFEWIGNYVLGNKHGGSLRELDVALFYPLQDRFLPVAALSYASFGTDQGVSLDRKNQKLYWAARGHGDQVWESTLNIPFLV